MPAQATEWYCISRERGGQEERKKGRRREGKGGRNRKGLVKEVREKLHGMRGFLELPISKPVSRHWRLNCYRKK